jgi:hypothetical protein
LLTSSAAHFAQVIHDEKAVAEHNRRAAANSGPAQSGKFDYKEYHHSIESERKVRNHEFSL